MNEKEAFKRLKLIRTKYEEKLFLNSREDVRKGIQYFIDAIDMANKSLWLTMPKSCAACKEQDKCNFDIDFCMEWGEHK